MKKRIASVHMARSLVEDVARKGKLFLKIKNKILVPILKVQVDPEVDVQVASGNRRGSRYNSY